MKCLKCDRNMESKGNVSFIGSVVNIHITSPEGAEAFYEIYPEFTGIAHIAVSLCYVCWFESMGISLDKVKAANAG